MEHRSLGRTGMHVGLLGFERGTDIGYGCAAQAAVARPMGGTLDAGLRFIDTADGERTSKLLSGRAVAHRWVSIVRE